VISAIPATHNGIRFRSRLEARWAMFFDLMRVDWRYEYEGYKLPSGWYVPDFWLPQIKTWVEIKPPFNVEYESERERKERAVTLCGELATATKNRVVLFAMDFGGWLPRWEDVYEEGTAFWSPRDKEAVSEFGADYQYLPCLCLECSTFGIEFEGRGDRICKHTKSDRGHTASHRIIQGAVDAVLAHNFHPGA
jgi:hypothetical protein